jgi:hypothetical protein
VNAAAVPSPFRLHTATTAPPHRWHCLGGCLTQGSENFLERTSDKSGVGPTTPWQTPQHIYIRPSNPSTDCQSVETSAGAGTASWSSIWPVVPSTTHSSTLRSGTSGDESPQKRRSPSTSMFGRSLTPRPTAGPRSSPPVRSTPGCSEAVRTRGHPVAGMAVNDGGAGRDGPSHEDMSIVDRHRCRERWAPASTAASLPRRRDHSLQLGSHPHRRRLEVPTGSLNIRRRDLP